MHVHLRRTLTLSVSALALLCAPLLLGHSGLPFVPDSAAVAGNGNGNGGDHGNSGGGGNGGGNGGGSDNSSGGGGGDSANVSHGSSDNGGGKSGARGKKSAVDSDVATTGEVDGSAAPRQRNLKAELAGLNSLKRNINGLMNSSDPRMDGIREFIVASAELEAAREVAATANEAFLEAKGSYLDLLDDLDLAPNTTPASLQEQLDALVIPEDDPVTEDIDESAAALAEQQALQDALQAIDGAWTALVEASDLAEEAAGDVADAEETAGDDDLKQALLMAANKNRASSPDYVSDDIMNWANDVLGVGDSKGLIDAYIAKQD